jgi:hypothetical protein
MNERKSKGSLQKRITGLIGKVRSASKLTVPILVIGLVVVLAVAGLAITGIAQGNNKAPSDEAIAFANRTSDLLTNTILAAALQAINETTAGTVEESKLSIGLVFSDSQTNFRLVGTFDPLEANDIPQDAFESAALAKALEGKPYTDVQRVSGKWFYRRSIPLSNFAPQCVLCHPNFASFAPTDPVGALMLKVPITRD